MGWPDNASLPVEVYAAWGADPAGDPGDWVWTSLTDRLQPTPIPMRRGASDGAGEVSASTATVVLGNDDGALTPLYAPGAYYPNVVLGTPIRLTLRRVEDGFTRTTSSGLGTADSGQQWTTSGGSAANFSTSAGVARISQSTVNVLRQARLDNVLLDTEQVVDTSTSALITGAALVTGVIARYVDSGVDFYWCRTEFNAGATTVMLKISRIRAGDIVDLASLVVPGLAYAANVPLRTRISVSGDRIGMKVWTASGTEPVGWHLETVDPDPLTAPGATGIETWLVPGNSNALPVTVSIRNYAVRVDLLNGFADSWMPVYTPISGGETRSTVRVTASGILRRLSQGQNPLGSALRRRILSLTDIVVGYWSLEGGGDQQQAPSTLPGGQPLAPVGTVEPDFGEVDGPGGSDTLPDLTSHGVLVGPVPQYTHTGEWQVEVWFRTDTGDSLDFTASVPLQWDTPGGTVVAWDALLFIGQGAFNPGLGNIRFDISGYTAPAGGGQPSEDDRLDVAESIIDVRSSVQGSWHQLQVCAEQVSTTIELTAYLNGHLLGSKVIAGQTLGPVTRVTVNPLQGAGAYAGVDGIGLSSVGHVVVYNTINDPVTYQAGLGYPGETATDRIARLCTEEGIPATVPDVESEPMGPQGLDTLLELLRQCERADMGILHERGWGLGYRPRIGRYNQDSRLVVDLGTYRRSDGTGQDQILSPVYDDQGIRNVWKVSRRNGLSETYSDAAHVAQQGARDDSVELDVATDDVLIHHAAWRVHVDSWEEMRYPGISIDLAANPDLIDGWLSLGVGDRVQQTNPPAPHPADAVDQIASGMSATLSPDKWSGQVVGYPARPWTVGVVEDEILGRADTDGSQWVDAVVAGTDTTALAVTTQGPVWINSAGYAAMFPFEVRTGGVTLSVTGIAGSVADNFNRSVGAGGFGTAPTGQPWSVGAGTASEFSVNGTVGRMALVSVNDLHVITLDTGSPDHDPIARLTLPVVPTGASITLRQYARWSDASNHYFAELSIQTDAVPMLRLYRRLATVATVIGGPVQLTPSHTAGGAWWIQCAAMGSTIRARAWLGGQPESRGWHITATDTALTSATRAGPGARRETSNSNGSQTIDVENFAVPALQIVTFDQAPTNGVTRTVPAGTALSLATPWRAAL